VSEQSWICAAKPLKPVSRPFGLVTQPFEFPARPADVALIPKQLRGMGVNDVLRLLTASFDADFLDTLYEELGKQLEKSAPVTADVAAAATKAGAATSGFARRT